MEISKNSKLYKVVDFISGLPICKSFMRRYVKYGIGYQILSLDNVCKLCIHLTIAFLMYSIFGFLLLISIYSSVANAYMWITDKTEVLPVTMFVIVGGIIAYVSILLLEYVAILIKFLYNKVYKSKKMAYLLNLWNSRPKIKLPKIRCPGINIKD